MTSPSRARATATLTRPPHPSPHSTPQYTPGDRLTLWVNKVGPYDNPTLTFNYHALPFCRPTAAAGTPPAKRFGGLGEILTGNDLIDSQLDLRFRVPVPRTPVCTQILDERSAAAFRKAVSRRYWFELFLDDLPAWGFVGPPMEKNAVGTPTAASIFTHQAFSISVNGDRVVGVGLKTTDPAPITPGAALAFSYSVEWVESATPFARRFDSYLDVSFFERRVHSFSVANAAAMVLVLVGLPVGILVRTLRADFRRYEGGDGLDALERAAGGGGGGEESGWKAVHGDVFRVPRRPEVLSALTGAGAQLAALAASTVTAAAVGDLWEDRGAVTSVAVAAYALTALLGGGVAGHHYARLGGRRWVRTACLTAAAFPSAVGVIGLALNTLATLWGSLAAVPFTAAFAVVAVWLLCAVPLTLLGAVLGRRAAGPTPLDAPCRVKRVPTPIPASPWWLTPPALIAGAGALPFAAIFVEVFFLFSALFSHRVYYVFGTLALVLFLLTCVTACVSVVATYTLLNAAEDWRWQWFSFGTGASVGFWVFAYSVHYFLFKTRMSGLFQTAFYFGHVAMLCVGLGGAMGSVAHLAAGAFVRAIYRGVKCD